MMRLCICTSLPDPSSSPSYMHKTSHEQINLHKITYLFLIIKAAIINAITPPPKPPAVIPIIRSLDAGGSVAGNLSETTKEEKTL